MLRHSGFQVLFIVEVQQNVTHYSIVGAYLFRARALEFALYVVFEEFVVRDIVLFCG